MKVELVDDIAKRRTDHNHRFILDLASKGAPTERSVAPLGISKIKSHAARKNTPLG